MAELTDVLVVGGGPAGLAAAITARKRGLQVLVVEASAPPIDKACCEGLLPDSVKALAALGISLRPSDGYAFRGIRFIDAEASAEAYFPAGPATGVRRTTLHQKMVDHAARCGISVQWRTRVTGLREDGVCLDGSLVRARWIIGADGANSVVRRWSGLDFPIQRGRRFAYRRHFWTRPWTDCMEVYWGQSMQVYITPVGASEICAAVVSREPRLRLEEALRRFPVLAARLGGSETTSAERGSTTSMLLLRRVCCGCVAVIGDASGCVDAITGEGLGLAFKQAGFLADAIAANDLARYEAAHRRLMRRPSLMAKLMLALDARPMLRRRVIRVSGRHPRLFARLLGAHVGASSATDLVATGALLGWRMLTA